MTTNSRTLSIKTIIERDYDRPRLTNVSVVASDETGKPVATLDGFMLNLGYYPELDDLDDVDFLDGRSPHAFEAFEVLAANKDAIETLLNNDFASCFIHLEDARVDQAYRGAGLALRLMREARFALSGDGRVVVLKAHPLEGRLSKKTQVRLASYYQSDKALELVPVNATALPGWLVANWDEQRMVDADGPVWRHRPSTQSSQ